MAARRIIMSRRKRYTRNFGRTLRSPAPVRTTVEWIRFEHEREPYGVFSYLRDAKDASSPSGRAEIAQLSRWFNDELGAPANATMERFWFRAEAREYVDKARRLAELVTFAGYPIVERRTRRVPGKVTWEDAQQVAVFTYRDAPQPRRG
jgi:hypothetical protein